MLSTIAATSLRELLRRRAALSLVTLLPLAFYAARIDLEGQAVRFLALGVGWAVATLALFSHVGSRHLDRRLAVVGASPTVLFAGRQIALIGTGLSIALVYLVLVSVTLDVQRLWAVGVLLATTVLIAAPLGAVVSLVLPRELEGALALLAIMATQMLADPDGTLAKLLPLWSTRELASYAVDPVGDEYLSRGLMHFVFVLVVAAVAAWVAAVVRLRPQRLPAVSV
ncbi:hypothetical protein [Amycolatopsis sp. 195334CR]|uniref:hypothetical protein n=1 Tax=Amycolatopsis sp. 195334CR TaxID=2814588 RepID=UPI001A8D50B1|nr:hypothetical protein [Amycolatopsis sp. 195334CR]MBN6041309.1 hypothetical protein [Amycolatopsis sp. 195334CR]